ncbi:MAG: ATP-binding protein [Leptolyngbyaceae cyanobacterium bins.302]|nr:ATP-binding protein [Leptolyngbyaceae cyanobacterium bins.302]
MTKDMDLSEFITMAAVNLTNCDREPIHIPGSIQPHGILLVLSEPTWEIEQISANTEALLGVPPQQLLGQPLSTLLDQTQILALQRCLQHDFEQANPLKLSMQPSGQPITFDGILHRSLQNKIILELEPTVQPEASNFFDFYQMTKGTLNLLQQAANLSQLCAVIAQEIRRLTGFDRVMIYQFDADQSGTVIAEAKASELESFLGLHYPDSDIPQQARRLYALNLLRLIPNVNYQPAPILANPASCSPAPTTSELPSLPDPQPHSAEHSHRSPTPNSCSPAAPTHSSIDLSFSVLRSVSPIHIEYLNNMGVSASMSISLMKEQQLWGLVACHHYTPRFVPYKIRTACVFLGQVMSLELASREANENLDYKIQLKSTQSRFINAISQAANLTEALAQEPASLLALVGAEGVAIYTEGTLTAIGRVPTDREIDALIDWLDDKFEQDLFVTDALSDVYPPATQYLDRASGLLALSITKIRKNYLLWFRPEQLQYVNWAGNPKKQQQVQPDGSVTLSPRRSFGLWQETVRGKSLPWQPCEIEGALELRSAIVGIVLRKADEISALNLELERSNVELDSFAYIASHDLKEPLRGIHNYSTFLLEDYQDVLDAEGISRLETLVRLTKRMEDLINSLLHFSRLGRQDLSMQLVDLNALMHNVSEVLHMSQQETSFEIRIPQPLPTIRGDRVLVEEVFTNLITNSLKYNNQAEKWVEVGWINGTFYIRDNGIGIRAEHQESIFRIFKRLHASTKYGGGTGAGLTIVKKIIERHGGKIWVESTYGEGSTFYFTMPT